MAVYHTHNNFTSGEISPQVQARTDLIAYKNGAIVMENALPVPQGGVTRRPGGHYVTRTKFKDKKARLIPFKFNVTQTYMFEVGDLYIRFFTQRARLEEASQGVENMADNGAGLIRVTITGHGYSTGNHVAIRAVAGTTEANDDWQITVIDADNFDLIGSAFTNAYVSGGTVAEIIELVTPWTEADLPDLRWAQDADLMFVVHPDYWPRQITRTSATTFSITTIDNVVDSTEPRWKRGPFQALNTTPTTMAPSVTTGSGTVTSSVAFFTADMVGMYMRIGGEVSGEQGVVRLTTFTNTTNMGFTVESTLDAAGATGNWALGAWGEDSGFPSDVTFFEQRLVFTRTAVEPQTVWMSALPDIYDFRIGAADDEPITFALRAADVDVIQWVSAHSDMLIGTQGAEYFVTGGNDGAITPSNLFVRQQSSHGSDPIRAVKTGAQIVFIQRGGSRLRDMQFSLEQDKYLSDDLTLLADHIAENDPFIDAAFQQTPNPTLWFPTTSGLLVSATIMLSQQVLAWGRHPVGGTNAAVEAVGVVPSTSGGMDDVWLITKRDINGTTVRHMEWLDEDMPCDAGLEGTFDPAVTIITGLDHLEGETVVMLGDGAVYSNKTVESGAVSVASGELSVSQAFLGLQFIPTIVPTYPEIEARDGSTFGRVKRHNKVLIFGLDTMTLEFDGEVAAARDTDDLMDQAPAVTVDSVFQFEQLGSAELLRSTIRQPLPLPFTLRAIYGELQVGN